MATAATVGDTSAIANADEFYADLPHPLSANIRPILEAVAGKLTEDEIDQWFIGFAWLTRGLGPIRN